MTTSAAPASLAPSAEARAAEAGAADADDLRIRRLKVSYGLLNAVSDLSIDVPAGSCLALLGPNGAGKSSVLGAISGAVRPVTGSVTLGDQHLERHPAHVVQRLGVCHVPEGRGVLPGLTVAENLRIMLPQEADRERALEIFPRLRERLAQHAGTMSGGEQQMLAVSAALGSNYRLLLIDEVSLGLAPVIVDELYTVLEGVRRTGVTIVLVEQFAERALALADAAAVLVKGRLVHRSDAATLLRDTDLLHALYLGGGS